MHIEKELYKIKQTNRYKTKSPKTQIVIGVSLRKGIQYLYRAAKRLNSKAIEIDVIGKVLLEKDARSKVSSVLNLRGLMPKTEVIKEEKLAVIE